MDAATGRGKFEGIGYDVPNNNTQLLLIRPYHNSRIRQLESKANFIFFGKNTEFLLERDYQLIKINQRHMQTHLSVLYLSEIKYLIDKL